MAKIKSSFFCQNCGASYAKWQGQCSSCKSWNTISEEILQKEEKTTWNHTEKYVKTEKPLKIQEIKTDVEARYNTQDQELNRVLGGGIVPGSLILLGGEPHFLSCLIIVSVLMIQRYSTKNSVENRCDQLAEPCDEILKRWEIKKTHDC